MRSSLVRGWPRTSPADPSARSDTTIPTTARLMLTSVCRGVSNPASVPRGVVQRARRERLEGQGQKRECVLEGLVVGVDVVAGRDDSVGDHVEQRVDDVIPEPTAVRERRRGIVASARPTVRNGEIQAEQVAVVDGK